MNRAVPLGKVIEELAVIVVPAYDGGNLDVALDAVATPPRPAT